MRRSDESGARVGKVWLGLPPLLTNLFHPEIGLPELTAGLRAKGHRAAQRDLNAELVYGRLTRAPALVELARWLLRSAPSDRPPPRRAADWRDCLVAAAHARGLGPDLAGRPLAEHLARGRRSTNRSHRPDDGWRTRGAPRPDRRDVADLDDEARASVRAFLTLCIEEDDFWIELVEALAWVLWAPRSALAGDLWRAARRDDLPLLRRLCDETLAGIERDLGVPDVVGLSIHAHEQLVPALALARAARARFPGALLVLGGPYCTAARELLPRVPALFEHIDALVVGDGHRSLEALLERRLRGEGPLGLPGVAALDGRGAVKCPDAAERPSLEDLPLPAFDGLPLEFYPDRRLPVRLHDGCPWGRCRLCYHVAPGHHRVGAPPVSDPYVERVVEHMRALAAETGVTRFVLLDHAVPFDTLARLARRLTAAGAPLEWDTMARFEPGLEADLCRALHEGGGRDLLMGLETIHAEGLRRIRKGIDLETVDRALSLLSEAGLRVRLFLMDFPGQSLEELRESFEWALERCPAVTDAMIGRFTLGMGTRSWHDREALGLRVADGGEPSLDVFQVPHTAEGVVPLEDYEAFWSEAKARFRAARTAADRAALGDPAYREATPRGASPARRGGRGRRRPDRRTRITLVGTGIDAPHARDESRRYSLAIGCLAAALAGDPDLEGRIETTLLDVPFALGERAFDDAVLRDVLRSEPDLLGLSCYAWDLEAQIQLAGQVRAARPDTRIVAGGPSVSYDARQVLERSPALDAVISGEGERAFATYVKGAHRRAGPRSGITWRDDAGEIHDGGLGRPVADLASLPSPLLAGVTDPPRENLLLELSRGCVHRCRHCAWQSHGRGVRTIPPARIRDEIAWAVDHGFSHAMVIDSSINWSDEWLEAVVGAVEEGDPGGDLHLSYFLDYAFVTPRQVEVLSRLKTHEILVGLESVNGAALAATGRDPDVVEPFTRAVELLAERVGAVTPNIMFAMPGDDLDGFRATLDFVAALAERPGPRRIRQLRVHWTIVPPGSWFHRHADRFGIRTHDGGVPYVLDTTTFPQADIRRGLEAIGGHRRADLFVWEDPEPVKILAEAAPRVGEPGGGRLGATSARPFSDDEVLRALRPLEPGRPIGSRWTVAPLERQEGWPVVVLVHERGARVGLRLLRRGSARGPLASAGPFDIVSADPQSGRGADAVARRFAEVLAKIVARGARR